MSASIDSIWTVHSKQQKRTLDWQFRGKVWHDWELCDHTAPVASLKSKRYFSLLFKGSFDGVKVLFKKSLRGSVTVSLSETGTKIGEFDFIFPTPVTLKMSDGTRYDITNPGHDNMFVMSDACGRSIACSQFSNAKTRQSAPISRSLTLWKGIPTLGLQQSFSSIQQ